PTPTPTRFPYTTLFRSQDSIFGKKKANIFATTDSSGNFQLRYLREDNYRIYALREQNNDRIYNSPDEWLGFLADSIALTSDTSGITLWTSRHRPEVFRVLDRQIDRTGRVWFKFNQMLEEPSVVITHPSEVDENETKELNPAKESVNRWVADMTFDSLEVNFYERDSLMDSVMIRRPRNDEYDRNITLTPNLDRNR